ncbi:ABC transporter permease [Arcanobacterium hippocoleae]|uniref:ABC-2 type transport system permease protein n=1 Tax=Arcanobacterium hippocoleae TaxID=149017 RepID=A0ABU1T017_9ACTO|nr:ABC transporter permease [Arcanobacterium hippocoleae]MDR6938699.1 ABC-2 type transport system permease protein [Arcanobacterium hippocoleae]
MHILAIIVKEIHSIKENPAFNVATIISPLLFLLAFTAMVSGGITLPVETQPNQSQSQFLQSAAAFQAPDGTPYLQLESSSKPGMTQARNIDGYTVTDEPQVNAAGISGSVTHVVTDVNANMTKNYANRLTGAAVNYINQHLDAGTVEIVEQTRYQVDIGWDTSFAVNTIIFGAILAGFLFGQLSMTNEWENSTTKLLALSPKPASMIAGGKIIAALIKSAVATAVLVTVIAFMFSLPINHPWHLVGAATLLAATFACLGLVLGIIVRSTMTAFLVSLVISLSLWVAGGGFGDLSYFGSLTQTIGMLNPVAYGLNAARYAYFGGTLQPITLPLLASGTIIVASITVIVFSKWMHSEQVVS